MSSERSGRRRRKDDSKRQRIATPQLTDKEREEEEKKAARKPKGMFAWYLICVLICTRPCIHISQSRSACLSVCFAPCFLLLSCVLLLFYFVVCISSRSSPLSTIPICQPTVTDTQPHHLHIFDRGCYFRAYWHCCSASIKLCYRGCRSL
jgi:hypothetical protein